MERTKGLLESALLARKGSVDADLTLEQLKKDAKSITAFLERSRQ